ncbi:MAG: PASTA domain-containing protein [Candidatus Zixiibacteriota bacterium]|nr:MAG: PASTA domain-containing protein [candidate division Zixibacteria bacterium]
MKNRINTTLKLWLQKAFGFIWGNKPVRYPVLLVGGVATAFLLLLLTDRVVLPVVVHWGEATRVPELVDLSLSEAEAISEEKGLRLEVLAEVHDPAKPPGTILSQIPPPNTKVREGRLVKITVSMGGRTVLVPKLQGVSIRQAEHLLMHEGLELGEISWSPSDSFPEDVVIASIPSHETPVPAGMPVNLTVSLGMRPDTVMVPDLVGTNIDQGKRMLREIGLELGRVRLKVNDDFLPGTILRQSLKPGKKVEMGSRIVLEVSTTE